MGSKSNYFRHTFNAHCDPKITNLIDRGGIKCVGVWFILLEVYGDLYSSDDSRSIVQTIGIRRIANATGLRSDSARTCIELISDCKLSESLCFKSDSTLFEVAIPNFLKYYGKYEKSGTIKCPNKRKEKERKEKERKEKAKQEIDVGAIEEFAGDNFRDDFLKNVGYEVQRSWLKSYDRDFIVKELTKIESWVLANSKKAPKTNFARFITGWLSRGWDTHRKTLPSKSLKETAQERQDRILNYEYPEF